MWLLIEVDKQEDVGKDEQRRILINDGCMDIFQDMCSLTIECNGVNVHPNTPDSATPSHAVSETKKCEICGHDMTMVDCDFWICPDYPHNAQEEFECHIDDHA